MASEQLEGIITMMAAMDVITGNIADDRTRVQTGAPMPDEIEHEMVDLGSTDGAWITAGVRDDAAIVYLHGGVYVLGGLATHGGFGKRLADESGLAVLVVDYRLGPEHHHPAALDDALAAVDWLIGRGISPDRIVVAGDSAGGGLTIATLAALRDRGITIAGAVAMSPWADLPCSNPTYETVGADAHMARSRRRRRMGDGSSPVPKRRAHVA